MDVFNYSTARQELSHILNLAFKNGEAKLTDKEGNLFVIKPEKPSKSPLDVGSINLNLTREEVLDIIKEGRNIFSK